MRSRVLPGSASAGPKPSIGAVLLLAALITLHCALLAAHARAQAQMQSEPDTGQKERRLDQITLQGHTFVAPLTLRSVPFDFALPIAQLASRTQVGIALVHGDRNVDQGPTDTRYALLSQAYDFSVRFPVDLEVGFSFPLLDIASGINGDSIVSGGASAAFGSNLWVAYNLLGHDKDQRFALTLRGIGHIEGGYRANVEPLIYQAASNPIALIDDGVNTASIASPTLELGGALAVSAAYAISSRLSLQGSARLDWLSTQVSPWLKKTGTEKAGARELVYQDFWSPSLAAAIGMYFGPVLIQPQLGVAWHNDRLHSPRQDRGSYTKACYFVPAVEIMYLVGPILQLGGGFGTEFAWSSLQDRYENKFHTSTFQPFGQLVARYLWGYSWPGD